MADLNATIASLSALSHNADTLFLVLMGMIVFFMQCGFAFLEAGAAYWIIGYAFAYGDGGAANKFIGATFFASSDLPDIRYAEFFFQYTFAATAATIVSGAMAERCEFTAYFAYSFFITGFIYPVVTHWAWGGGWLADGLTYDGIGQVAYQDFAGSGVVHVLGGVAAFVGAAMLGARHGRFHHGQVIPMRGHSVPIAALGGFILFFGFLAFNGGSQLTISNPGDGEAVSLAIVNTIISASFAAFGSLLINRLKILGNSWSLLVTINGALTGMVAACAGCNRMYPWGACVLGVFASLSYTFWSWLVKKMRIDDPLDAVAVHFGGGIWGVIGIAFLDRKDGILMYWDERSGYKLAWQLAGLSAIIGWTAFFSILLFGTLRCIGVLRVPEEIEEKGLDIPKHNEPAYPAEAYGHGHVEHLKQVMHNRPINVVQSYENLAFERRVSDKGPYEHPELKAVNGYHERESVRSLPRENGSKQGRRYRPEPELQYVYRAPYQYQYPLFPY